MKTASEGNPQGTSLSTVAAWLRHTRIPGWRGATSKCTKQLAFFAFVASVYFLYSLASNERHFYFDSQTYWRTAKSLSLAEYDNPLRGYAFPFFCLVVRRMAHAIGINEFVLFWAANASLMSAFGTLLVPGLVRTIFPWLRFGWWGILGFNGLVFLFYRGYAAYPLTDFPALALLVTALWCLLSRPRWSLVGGVALALAINCRPIYLLATAGVLFLLGWRLLTACKKGAWRIGAIGCVGFMLGLGVGLGPQLYINHHRFQRLSVLPPTDLYYGKNLYLWQLEMGLRLQRYETNVGKTYPHKSVSFDDRVGTAILSSAPPGGLESYGDWFSLWVSSPRSLLALYGRHLFNGMDVVYPTAYLDAPHERSILMAMVNYGLIFLFLVRTRSTFLFVLRSPSLLAVVGSLALPVAAAIPTAVETRFFLPLHTLIYATLSFGGAGSVLRARYAKLGTFACLLLFLLFCYALSSATFSTMEHLGEPY